jgi:hypothetical protein
VNVDPSASSCSQASSRLPPSILGRAFAGILADELNAAAQASRLAGDGPIEPSRAHLHVLFGTDEQCSVKDALNSESHLKHYFWLKI